MTNQTTISTEATYSIAEQVFNRRGPRHQVTSEIFWELYDQLIPTTPLRTEEDRLETCKEIAAYVFEYLVEDNQFSSRTSEETKFGIFATLVALVMAAEKMNANPRDWEFSFNFDSDNVYNVFIEIPQGKFSTEKQSRKIGAEIVDQLIASPWATVLLPFLYSFSITDASTGDTILTKFFQMG